jgi:flagellar protein FlgJ
MVDSLKATNLNVPGSAARATDSPEKIKDAGKQFEALLIAQMMKSMRDSEGGWLGTGEDDSSQSAMEYGQEAFAQAMANSGGLGLADMIARGLQKSATETAKSQ